MMDRGDSCRAVLCQYCEKAFTLPEEEVDCNPARVLMCGHIFCTTCLRSIEHGNVIKCPDCEVESTLPERGVYGLQEDDRIIGLIYTAKMNKNKSLRSDRSEYRWRSKCSPSTDIKGSTEDVEPTTDIENVKRAVDEALARAAEDLAQLEHMHKTLTTGLPEQAQRDRARLETEIKRVADEAVNDIQKWRDVQLNGLMKLEAQFPTSQAEVWHVQERIKALQLAMQYAREVRRFPLLEQYCTLDKVLQTLQAPFDNQSFDMKGISLISGLSCVFRSECHALSLGLSLKMEVRHPKALSELLLHQLGSYNKKSPWQRARGENTTCIPHCCNKYPSPQRQKQESPAAISSPSQGSSPRPPHRLNCSRHTSASDLSHLSPDVIIEEFLDTDKEPAAVPPTGPQLANDKWRIQRRGKKKLDRKRHITQLVVVTHVVTPSHFYIHYLAEKRESDVLSKKINHLCCRDTCFFSSRDTVESGSMIFVKGEEGLWCRASVVEVFQNGCSETVKVCPITQLSGVRVFFLDSGNTQSINIQSVDEATGSSLTAVNSQLRKAAEAVIAELSHFVPQAIRCSLMDIVPYDPTMGWSIEAQVEFSKVVGSAAVEMRVLGQDRDSLLVDLRKTPMNQWIDMPVSVREYLVFIEVARFYSPVKLGRRPLLYCPPVRPSVNTELNAVLSHINNPADFHIQLVENMEYLLLSVKLQDCYNGNTREDDLVVYCPVIGQACVARYQDNLWYRAQVIGHPRHRKVEVRYVDFGNKKIVSVSDLRKIKDEFFSLPAQALHCCLSDVSPLDGETWSDACTQRFISLAHQKLVTIVATGKVSKTEPLPVRLFGSSLDGPLANIAELLVTEELACFREVPKSTDTSPFNDSAVWDSPLELGSAADDLDCSDQNHVEEPLDFQAQLQFPDDLKEQKVRVSHVNSPSSFYVQFAQNKSQLIRVCELLKQEVTLMEPQDVVWKADMYCAAHINGVWERGQICSVSFDSIAEVFCCDHGNKAKLHVGNLQPLPSSLTGSFALECSLNDIRPAGGRSTWTATACDFLSYYLSGASAVMTIKELTDERPVPVTLLCTNKTGQLVSVSDFLASEGLALRERKPKDAVIQSPKDPDERSPVSTTQEEASDQATVNPPPASPPIPFPLPPFSDLPLAHVKPSPHVIMSAEKVRTQLYCPPELPSLGHTQMTVSAIGEDGLIYARTQDAECILKQLHKRIQQGIKTLPAQKPYTWKSVQGCVVIGRDMLWYRGQLLEVLGGHVMVQNVDCGLVENIPVVHVHPMLLCDDVPQLCVPCQLHAVNPVGGRWQRDALDLLREMLLNRCVNIQVLELPSDPRRPLTVELFLDGLNLSRILYHHKHTYMDRAVSPQEHSVPSDVPFLDDWNIDTEGLKGPEEVMLGTFISPNLPQVGEQFRVQVKHLRTPNELFLWPLNGTADVLVDGETLHEAMTRVNTNMENLPQLTSFPHGSPCLAEYSDGKYYRAMMLKFVSVEPVMILVQHVDFGSDDTLPTSKLRQIPAELLQFPTLALKVRVAGFKAPSVNREEDVLPYSPGWSVKAVVKMTDLLHGNITASVVALEPELTVLLYDEDGEAVHLPLVYSGLAELE